MMSNWRDSCSFLTNCTYTTILLVKTLEQNNLEIQIFTRKLSGKYDLLKNNLKINSRKKYVYFISHVFRGWSLTALLSLRKRSSASMEMSSISSSISSAILPFCSDRCSDLLTVCGLFVKLCLYKKKNDISVIFLSY